MNILLIGAGGREDALALAIAKSPRTRRLFIAPGNAGTERHGRNVALDVADAQAVINFCRAEAIDLVVVGPEGPLVAGLVDALEDAGLRAFGPRKGAAQLEGSKSFTKEICDEAGIPTASYVGACSLEAARAAVQASGAPIVVKYDGLMAGKGVTVAQSVEEAEAALEAIYANEPRAMVVIEECLVGTEASLFCFVDGETVRVIGDAQDYKRVFDGDRGPNTGGMGAISPAPALTPALVERALATIVRPTAKTMVARGLPYRGVLYAGLILTDAGPKLIEYNCRFGDPETQVLMLRLETDLVDLMLAVLEGRLAEAEITLSPDTAIVVVMATTGYPGAYASGSVIGGLAGADQCEGAVVFHVGTRRAGGDVLAAGGRVLGIAARGKDGAEARARAYGAIGKIDWPEGFCRTDIGA